MEDTMNIDQRSEEWFESRLGRLTASRFGDLLTMPRSKKDREAGMVSQTTKSYLIEKVTEMLTGESREMESDGLDWGTTTEQEAREFYELSRIIEVKQVGFIPYKELPIVGGSPDGLVGDDGIIEIKCPYNSNNHTEYLYDSPIPKSYYAQIQGNLMVTKRKWCDFIIYNPRVKNEKFRMIVRRVYRDEEFISGLKEAISIALKNYEVLLSRVDLTLDDVLNDKTEAQD